MPSLEWTQRRRITIRERALHRDLHHLRREPVGIDPCNQHPSRVRFPHSKQQPGAFRDPVDGMNIGRSDRLREQRVTKRDMRPARGDGRVHPPHQGREECAARSAPGGVAEPELPG